MNEPTIPQIIILAITIYASWTLGICDAESNQITDEKAIRAIIGEASDQGQRGMMAVACAIRNRGTLKGVYGLQAKHVDSEPEYIWKFAEAAWILSRKVDIVDGADHWHNVDREGETSWTKVYKKTVKIGDHQFYKSK